MTASRSGNDAGPLKFGIGQPVPRQEDSGLLRGLGRYTDDINLPGQAYAVIVRSPMAHGLLNRIDTSAADRMPGVLGAWTGKDLREAGYGTIKTIAMAQNRDGSPMKIPPRYPICTDKVRFVGDPIAFVVAETSAQARDAAEAVEVEIEALPAVIDARAAASPGAPLVFDEVAENVCLDFHYGDTDKVAEAFAQAAHVTRLRLISNRIVVCAMEPRSAIAQYDPSADRYTLHSCSQGVFGLRRLLAGLLNFKPEQLRILTGNVGGSFGMKPAPYPEYACVIYAAKALGRPVKWTDDRSGSFLSDQHGRDHDFDAELALDKDGTFLAVRLNGYANAGGYLTHVGFLMATRLVTSTLPTIYRTPLVEVSSKIVFTHTSPVGAYRGAGRPEANYFMERLIDAAARETGIDRIELRRRNHVRPEEMPFKTASQGVYDSGEFTILLDKALVAADVAGFAKRRAESAAKGKLRGLGIGDYLEPTAGPQSEMGGIHFEPNGDVTIVTGTLDYGQGHWTSFAQVLAEKLGVPFSRIKLVQGDSDRLVIGGGSGGSRSMIASGVAIVAASEKVIERGKQIAGVILEASPVDIVFERGRFGIVGTDRGIDIMELAERLRSGLALPPDVPASLDIDHVQEGSPSSYPNGAHVAEVEIDPDTGVVEVVKYTMTSDYGTVVNPLLAEGQSHGGVVQGIGQALFEHVVYSEDGQPLSGNFTDYALPRASDVPAFSASYHAVPARTNVLGVKGCGEAGCSGSLPSVMNAISDALGGRHIDMPATPQRVWQALNG
jgi:carbon-monoxide dehydrogenase large subunit